jgi:type IV secretory pathway VirD2 relaxase
MSWRGVLWRAIEETAEERARLAPRLSAGGAKEAKPTARTAMLKAMGAARRFPRGASAALTGGAAKRAGFTFSTGQRVVVKAHVAKHGSSAFGGKGGGGAIRAHVNYLEREGRDGPERGEFYDREVDGLDAKAQTRDWGEDRHHFRFIVSPEHGDKLDDLRANVRDMMDGAERDLGQRLDWLAINHFDTDQPHAHVLVRGRREDERDLFISKDYMAHGLRLRAQEAARDHLGDLTREQAEERVRNEITLDRPTSLDRHLQHGRDQDGCIHRQLTDDRGPAGAVLRGRLQHLEGLGLAAREGGAWRVEADFIAKLDALHRERDVLRAIHQTMRHGRDAPTVLHDGQIAGRVVDVVRSEDSAAHFATLRSAGEREVMIRLGPEQSVQVGDSLVATVATDRDPVRSNLGDVREGVAEMRLSPLDQLIEWRGRERQEGLTPPVFDRDTETAIRAREHGLIAHGFAHDTPEGVRHTPDGWRLLRENDIAASIEEQLGRKAGFVRDAFSQNEGVYLGAIKTQSGMFAVMDRGRELMIGRIEKAPTISIGNAISFDPGKGLIQNLGRGAGLDFGLDLGR